MWGVRLWRPVACCRTLQQSARKPARPSAQREAHGDAVPALRTPYMEEYWKLKERYPDHILLFQKGRSVELLIVCFSKTIY